MRQTLSIREVPKFMRSAGSADSTYMVKSRAAGSKKNKKYLLLLFFFFFLFM